MILKIAPDFLTSDVLITLLLWHPGPCAAATVRPRAWSPPPALDPEGFVEEWGEAVSKPPNFPAQARELLHDEGL